MEIDEIGTLTELKKHRQELIDATITKHGRRMVNVVGDGMLVEFRNIPDAVTCAAEIQQGMVVRNDDDPQRVASVTPRSWGKVSG